MKNSCLFALVIGLIFFVGILGCAPKQIPSFPEGVETTCLKGQVWYRNPIDSAQVRYSNATVTAWHHENDKPIVDTKTDKRGNYCMEVPLGDFSVDLRVWGTKYLKDSTYVCDGSEDNIDMGSTPKKCGEDCLEINIMTDCRKFVPRRHVPVED
jgi:hypothetical protein